MNSRPILFSAPMVLALLAGTKTQTRRIVKGDIATVRSPYGAPGDRLWVRETWRLNWASGEGSEVEYRADGAKRVWPVNARSSKFLDGGVKWKPSIFLQRQFSRLTLEIAGVRVERLCAISESDAKAEGIVGWTKDGTLYKYGAISPGDGGSTPWVDMPRTAVAAYESLWESINGADSWAANPWVWVVEFRVLR